MVDGPLGRAPGWTAHSALRKMVPSEGRLFPTWILKLARRSARPVEHQQRLRERYHTLRAVKNRVRRPKQGAKNSPHRSAEFGHYHNYKII
jgi:hypothetical protein